MSWGEGDERACGNCRWNGNYKRCSFWQADQDPGTLARATSHRRIRSTVDPITARDAFNDLDHVRGTIHSIAERMDRAIQRLQRVCNEGQTDALEGLVDQLRTMMLSTKTQHEIMRKLAIPDTLQN